MARGTDVLFTATSVHLPSHPTNKDGRATDNAIDRLAVRACIGWGSNDIRCLFNNRAPNGVIAQNLKIVQFGRKNSGCKGLWNVQSKWTCSGFKEIIADGKVSFICGLDKGGEFTQLRRWMLLRQCLFDGTHSTHLMFQ